MVHKAQYYCLHSLGGSILLREYLAVYHVYSREQAILLPIAKKTLWDNFGKARDVVEP